MHFVKNSTIAVVSVIVLHNNILQQFRYTYIFSVILLLFCYKDKHCSNTLRPSGKEERFSQYFIQTLLFELIWKASLKVTTEFIL